MLCIYSRKHGATVYLCHALASSFLVDAVVLRTRLWTVRATMPLETDGKLTREGVLFLDIMVLFFSKSINPTVVWKSHHVFAPLGVVFG